MSQVFVVSLELGQSVRYRFGRRVRVLLEVSSVVDSALELVLPFSPWVEVYGLAVYSCLCPRQVDMGVLSFEHYGEDDRFVFDDPRVSDCMLCSCLRFIYPGDVLCMCCTLQLVCVVSQCVDHVGHR